jgi:hypothetical protein
MSRVSDKSEMHTTGGNCNSYYSSPVPHRDPRGMKFGSGNATTRCEIDFRLFGTFAGLIDDSDPFVWPVTGLYCWLVADKPDEYSDISCIYSDD